MLIRALSEIVGGLVKGVWHLIFKPGSAKGLGGAIANLTTGAIVVGGATAVGVAGYSAYEKVTNPKAVEIPSQYQGQAPAAPTNYSHSGDKQTFANFAPVSTGQPTVSSGYNQPILKRTHEAIASGKLVPQAAAPAPAVQGFVNLKPAPAVAQAPRGPNLENLVTEYERAYADSLQVMMSDPSKKEQMEREKAKIFDQIAAIVFPQPKAPANKEAVDYVHSREKEDQRAIGDLIQSLQFLEEASKER